MPLTTDPILGEAYLAPGDFMAAAAFYGAQTAIAGLTAAQLVPLAAMASRAIDSYAGRSFQPESITENHAWNPETRRIKVNSPPVLTLQSYVIRTAPGLVSTFQVANVYVNNQENYIELASLALAGSLTSTMLSLGLTEPQVEITYLSYQSVPQAVVAACGYTMAKMANEGYASSQVPDGFTQIRMGGMSGMQIMRRNQTDDTDLLPPVAKQLLRPYTRIAIA